MKKVNILAALGILVVAAVLMAQAPVQLQTVNGGGALLLGNGVAAGSLRVSLASDSTGQVALAAGTNGIGSLTAGAAVIGAVSQNGAWTVQPGNTANTTPWLTSISTWAAGTLGAMANYGTSPGAVLVPGVNAFVTNPITATATIAPQTGSGFAFSRFHAATGAAANIKASAGNLYGLNIGNNGVNACFVQLMNTAGTPTAGTGVVDSYFVQAGVTVALPPGIIAMENFSTGIGVAAATTDGGSTTTGCTTTLSITAYYF